MAVPPIFRDEKLQRLFDKQGFVVVPFLDPEEIAQLDKIFDTLHPELPSGVGFVSGSYSNDFEYKKKASDAIIHIYRRHFDRLFQNYQTFGAAFLYKQPSDHSELGVHQDWTIVDEHQFVALNCWVPLTDINENNGALYVLPGSQFPKKNTLRSPTIPFFFSGNENDVIRETIPFYIKAGQAVILNQSVIHFSPPNRSDRIRKAITAGVKTKDAPMLFHYKNEEGKVIQYKMPEDFLIRFENFATSIFQEPVLGEKISDQVYENPILEKAELQTVIRKLKKEAQPSFLEKITQLFSA
jgi:hypothetical protein